MFKILRIQIIESYLSQSLLLLKMAIHIPLEKIPREIKDLLPEQLTIQQIDEKYEKMKKAGKIMPGYTQDPVNSKIICFDVVNAVVRIPYFYARDNLAFKTLDVTPNPDNYSMLDESIENEVQLRDNQIEAVKTCFNNLVKYGTTTVGLPPGRGKTYIGAFLVHCLRLKAVVVVPRRTLLEQWRKTFEIGLPKAKVWVIDESGKIPSDEIPDIIIALDPRIVKIPDAWKFKIGTLIIDEAHMLPTRGRIENLLSFSPAYIIMETATMERGDGLHKICQLIGGTHGVFETSMSPYSFKIVQLPFIEAEEKSGYRGIDYTSLCNSLSEIAEYNRAIVNIVCHNPDNKFIVLTKRVDHGDKLKALFLEIGITCDTLMGTKKKYNNSRVLIGTFSKIGTGFDEATASEEFQGPTSDSLIICHSVSKIPNFEQYRGRVMRTANPTVYWLNVKNRIIRSHLTEIKKHVVKTKGTIIVEDGIKYMKSSVSLT
jgi:superfamily II DNA or RNA helicase